MIYYVLLPFLSLLLIVIQTTAADILFSGNLGMELSLIIVIYAGFRLDIMKGGILSFTLGFFRDCLNCSISGPYTFLYVTIFLLTMLASFRISTDKSSFMIIFTLLCALFEIIVIASFKPVLYGGDISTFAFKAYVFQALILGSLAPILIRSLSRIDVLLSGENARTVKRV